MLKLSLCIIILSQIISLIPIHAMEQKEKSYYSIYLPCQNGHGGTSFAENNLINVDQKNHKQYTTLGIDTNLAATSDICKIDLGQDNCIKHFKKQLIDDESAKNKVLMLSGSSLCKKDI